MVSRVDGADNHSKDIMITTLDLIKLKTRFPTTGIQTNKSNCYIKLVSPDYFNTERSLTLRATMAILEAAFHMQF